MKTPVLQSLSNKVAALNALRTPILKKLCERLLLNQREQIM